MLRSLAGRCRLPFGIPCGIPSRIPCGMRSAIPCGMRGAMRSAIPPQLQGLDLPQEARAIEPALQKMGQVGLQMLFDFLADRLPEIGGGGRLKAAALEMAKHLERLETQRAGPGMAAPALWAEDASQCRAEELRFRTNLRRALDTPKELRPVPHQLKQPKLVVAQHGRRGAPLRQSFECFEHHRVGWAAAPLVEGEAVDQLHHI